MSRKKPKEEEFTLVERSLLDSWAKAAQELRGSIIWLKDERQRLVEENDSLLSGTKEMNESAKVLIKMYEELQGQNKILVEENKKLLDAMTGFGRAGSERNN